MIRYNIYIVKDVTRYLILLGIPFISMVGSIMHFIYDWSGKLILVGIIAPVNESVWEHLKLTFLPTIFWWVFSYFILSKRDNICYVQWFFSSAVSVFVCLLFIVSFYYTYTGALGIQSLFLDILSLFLGVTISQFTALHIYNHAKITSFQLYFAIGMLIILAIGFTVFTFKPPHVPLFMDSITGKYGIY